ncbi:hypothetical protein T484DRAFT_1961321 [Baffinella frigidus]|nr:hypothetical protein T484DRAFT_1961321 [Cryptophyta sp. CCMP2293]|mmetsp:Transcript_52761/g.125597  ORF Transcript_52761/g.125597 Transcript_52761/m.125597 type:complete len:253 (+) Transcript_52761:22-780(+)
MRSSSPPVGCLPGWSCLMGKRREADEGGRIGSGVGVGRIVYHCADEARPVRSVHPVGTFEANEVAGKSTVVRNAAQGVDVEVAVGNIWMGPCNDEVALEPRGQDKIGPDVDLHIVLRSDSSVSADLTMYPAVSDDSFVHGCASNNSFMRTSGPFRSGSSFRLERASSRSPLRRGPLAPPASRTNDPPTLSSPEDASSIFIQLQSHDSIATERGLTFHDSFKNPPLVAFDSSYLEAAWNSAPAHDADPNQALL